MTEAEIKPSISIVVPVYNVARYLKQCVDSLLQQTFTDFELILVDDGSTDISGMICDEYAQLDNRIRVIHKENGGLSDARNAGMTYAKADWIGFVDSDDWVEPDMYELLYHTCITQKVDITVCGAFMDYVDATLPMTRQTGRTTVYDSEEGLWHILDDKHIRSYAWNKLYHRNVITAPFPKGRYYEDYATIYKWFSAARKAAFVDVEKYHYRQRGSGICLNFNPEKNFHFFLAVFERYDFVKHQALLPTKEKELLKAVAVHALRETRNIVRLGRNKSMCMTYIQKVGSMLVDTKQLTCNDLGLKKYLRLQCLLRHPCWFYYLISMGVIKHPNKQYILYK